MDNNQSQLIERRLTGLEIAKEHLETRDASNEAMNNNQSQPIDALTKA